MAIKRYLANKDNTIVNTYQSNLQTRGTGSNTGYADVMEVYSIYGRESSGSQELSRILVEFPISDISTDRTAGVIPASGSISYYLRLFNAQHSKTVPEDYTITVNPLSRSWQEGTGLDLENYKDVTRGNIGSNWMSASNTTGWTNVGGDYYEMPSYAYTQTFENGLEDLEIDITNLVEEQIAGLSSQTSAFIYYALRFAGVGQEANYNDRRFKLTDSFGVTKTFEYNYSQAVDAGAIEIDIRPATIGALQSNIPAAVTQVINAVNGAGFNVTASLLDGYTTIAKFEQKDPGAQGNTAIVKQNYNGSESEWQTETVNTYHYFPKNPADHYSTAAEHSTMVSGSGFPNYGVLVKLSSSFEASASASDTAADPAVITNPDGATTSYYTKRFFARGSQYFFKRPVIEARWNDRVVDDRGNFYYSSSLAPAADNLNTLYLYNYVRGVLTNIPAIGTGEIYVDLYSGSSTPTGSALIQSVATPATGGYVSTGIYSCSVCLTAASTPLTTLFDVWHSGGVEYFTGSISPIVHYAAQTSRKPVYYLNITNNKGKYRSDETARFNLYIRNKYWNPTIYTVADATPATTTIESASYRVYRTLDGYEAIPYGTGSDLHTLLSHDVSGNYFDFDMSLLQPGYQYAFKFSFYEASINSWSEQSETFTFRVEEYEY